MRPVRILAASRISQASILRRMRRFIAYTDKALALRSYKARKFWQMRHAQLSMERAKAAIGYFGSLEIESAVPAEAVTIPNEYIQGLGWGDC